MTTSIEILVLTLLICIVIYLLVLAYKLYNKPVLKDTNVVIGSPTPIQKYEELIHQMTENYKLYKDAEQKREKYEKMKSIWQDSSEDDPVSRGKLSEIENQIIALNVTYKTCRNVVIRHSRKLIDDGIVPLVNDADVCAIIFEHIDEKEMEIDDK